MLDAGVTTGMPVLNIVNGHTISIDLSDVTWNGDFSALTAGITLQGPVAAVPEPATAWMMMAGLAGIGMLARRRRSGGGNSGPSPR